MMDELREALGLVDHTQVQKSGYRTVEILNIKRVIFNDPVTVVLWTDGSKTVVRCQDGDTYSEEVGISMCVMKRVFGNTGKYNEIFKRFIPDYEEDDCPVRFYVEQNDRVYKLIDGELKMLTVESGERVKARFLPKRKRGKVNDETILRLSNSGVPVKEIAKQLNLNMSTVYKHIKALEDET